MNILLKRTIESDLEIFFKNQTDEEANHMAAFTSENPNDKDAYLNKWRKLMHKDSIHMQSIHLDQRVIGCVVKYEMEGEAEITYAISKEFWGKGLTTQAVKKFLSIELARPIFGHVAYDNLGSQKILEKTGFEKIGTERGFANARGKEIEEYVYKLEK